MTSLNFDHLQEISPELHRLGTLAERFFADDANTLLIKSRQFGEYMVKEIAALFGAYDSAARETTNDFLGRLATQQVLPREVADVFHSGRKSGNDATHNLPGSPAEAFATPILIVSKKQQAFPGRQQTESPTPNDVHFRQHLSEIWRVSPDSGVVSSAPQCQSMGRILNCR